MSAELLEAYHKYTPRWFKVIKWRQFALRTIEHQKFLAKVGYAPLLLIYIYISDKASHWIAWKKPQTEEELLEIKRYYNWNHYQRNWDIDQYRYNHPPMYDLWERRQKYPQYYKGRYENKYQRDGPHYM